MRSSVDTTKTARKGNPPNRANVFTRVGCPIEIKPTVFVERAVVVCDQQVTHIKWTFSKNIRYIFCMYEVYPEGAVIIEIHVLRV